MLFYLPPIRLACNDSTNPCMKHPEMSSETALESAEDLEIVPVARLEDIQPRGRTSESYDEVLETFVIDDTYECLVEDEDSNIGSMVSIQSEEVVEYEDEVECEDDTAELIVPELLEPADAVATKTKTQPKLNDSVPQSKPSHPESWPTLEILPGGVINSTDKNDVTNLYPNVVDRDAMEEPGDMMYACAKCSQSFKYLFCLVKHVKWHEDEAKKAKQGTDLSKLSALEKDLVLIKRARIELERSHKKQKVEVYSRIADSLKKIDSIKEIFK